MSFRCLIIVFDYKPGSSKEFYKVLVQILFVNVLKYKNFSAALSVEYMGGSRILGKGGTSSAKFHVRPEAPLESGGFPRKIKISGCFRCDILASTEIIYTVLFRKAP